MKDYQEAFKQEFGIQFSESELQFALAFIVEYGNARELEGVEKVRDRIDIKINDPQIIRQTGVSVGLGIARGICRQVTGELKEDHLPDRPLNSERD